MLLELKQNIENEQLLQPSDRLLLTVSGGCDSMVMLDLFRQLEYEFVVAHCNFKLRGSESDSDEYFLRDYCAEHGIEIYVKSFDTNEYALKESISIEMAARELRYEWFFELLKSLNFQYVLTAHHQDDLVETMLVNLCRGTGIRGLSGIQAKKGQLIRPMLFASQQLITDYASSLAIPFQTDSSNHELIYQRNIIRHKIIPLLEEINPAFKLNAAKTATILKQTEQFYRNKIEEEKQQFLIKDNSTLKLDIAYLKQSAFAKTLLFEVLHPFGFNASQTDKISQVLDSETGKVFLSETHSLVKDRKYLVLSEIADESFARYYIEANCQEISKPIKMQFSHLKKSGDYRISPNPIIADFDFDKLQFPLVLKKWAQGEYFQPLGMTGFKKLSDFFIDEKFSIPEKESCWILYSAGKVAWITGHRIDNRFKISSNTQSIFRIKCSV